MTLLAVGAVLPNLGGLVWAFVPRASARAGVAGPAGASSGGGLLPPPTEFPQDVLVGSPSAPEPALVAFRRRGCSTFQVTDRAQPDTDRPLSVDRRSTLAGLQGTPLRQAADGISRAIAPLGAVWSRPANVATVGSS